MGKPGLIERALCRLFRLQNIEHKGDLYLRRWLLTPSLRGWRLMLHRIARPDLDRTPHDHPWDFATLCLRGGYVETVIGPGGRREESIAAGQSRLRAAEHTHRIDRILGPNAWTLVLHGPRRREWGFWLGLDHGSAFPTFAGFVPARVYLGTNEQSDRVAARGVAS